MKRLIVFLFIISNLGVNSQPLEFHSLSLDGVIIQSISRSLPEGTNLTYTGITKSSSDGFTRYKFLVNGNEELVDPRRIDRIKFKPNSIKEFWQVKALENEVYSNIFKNGFQYDLRKEIEEEAIDYLNYLSQNNLIFKDSYLESYLYQLVYRIYPIRINDGRPGIINVTLLKDVDPNAFIFPNGTLIITTGLLSTIDSEEELIAVLSHEIAHFVLDHSVININEATQRQKRAEFWAAFATGVAAAVDIYASTNNNYYAAGSITASTAILSYSIATMITERLGLQYSREQEFAADKCAVELMKFINTKPNALSSVLSKIKNYSILNGNYYALSGKGSHPAIDDRIKSIGEPSEFNDINYNRRISFVNTYNAIEALNNNNFLKSKELSEKNLKSNVATEDDYLILALVNTYMYDSEKENLKSLELIAKAKKLNIYPNINLPKQEAIILIRLGRKEEAKKSLLEYIQNLEKERLFTEKQYSPADYSKISSFINSEIKWSMKMRNKIDHL